MLKSKKHNTQEEWINAWNDAKKFVKTEEGINKAETLINTAISRIPKNKKCIYGWSGGKDAIALQVICERAGIKNCVLGTIGFNYEYPEFVEYIKNNAPEGLVIKDFKITEKFLNEHPKLFLPENSSDNYFWYKFCNQKAYKTYADEVKADYIILGLRTQDGNVVKNRKDKRQISPMYDFTHEDIFTIMAYANKELPPIYLYPEGFKQGTHSWVMRSGGEKELINIYKIDKNIILNNKELNKIKKFLEEKKYEYNN